MWQSLKNCYHLFQAAVAAVFFNFPSRNITVVGVTGTDGKTTTVHMIYEILRSISPKCSMISSVYAAIGSKTFETGFHVTTPSSWQVQKYLRKSVDSGHKYFVLETTSHGLHQNRLAFVNFDISVLTNITHDHIDYHKTWENYALAKARLFKKTNVSVLNTDDEKSYKFLKNKVSGKLVTYSINSESDVNTKKFPLKLKVQGDYNLSNALAAAATASALGISRKKITKSLNNFGGVRGRLDKITEKNNFDVYIDFAHTPNGLKQALTTLRSAKKGRLIAVFGAAGKRDYSKRQSMGAVADELADVIVLTSEDPRDESPEKISQEIARGIKSKKTDVNLFFVPDRAKAIEKAITMCAPGDIAAFFGKGHERSMAIGKKETPWDEYESVKLALRKKKNGTVG